jgi:adenylate cyclase
VSRKVVQMLEVTLTKSERARWPGRGKVNAEAYDYLIRGRSCLLNFNAAALIEGRAMLERAIAIDAGLAQAYAYLALACVYEYVNAWNGRTASHLEQALALARKAHEVEPFEPMSHHAMAVALMMLRRLDEAESAARRAIELDPNFSLSHGALGNVLHFTGRHEQALESLERALRLDPEFNVWLHAMGRAEFALGRYAEAEEMFKRRLIHMPKSDVTRAYLASLYGHTDRQDEARRVWGELMAINPDYTVEHTLRVLPFTNPKPLEHFVEGLRKSGLAQ